VDIIWTTIANELFQFCLMLTFYLQAYTKLVAYRAFLGPCLFLLVLMPTYIKFIYVENSMVTKLPWTVLGPSLPPLDLMPTYAYGEQHNDELMGPGLPLFHLIPTYTLGEQHEDELTVSCVGPWASSLLSDGHLCIRRTAWWWSYCELCWALGFLSFIWWPPMH
jgi:hypothetical protein